MNAQLALATHRPASVTPKGAPNGCCGACTPKCHEDAAPVRPVAAPEPRGFWSDRQAWRLAARNTLNCLIGCMIGDFAMVIYMQARHPEAPMALTMGLAMVAGLVTSVLFESCLLKLKEGFRWGAAVRMAFSMSFLSMLGMELAANATDFALTGGRVPLDDPFYWAALAISLVAGFVAPLPYNYWKFKRHGRACH
jgi:hypothetical protein